MTIEFNFTDQIPVTKIQQCGGDHMVVAAAKVSVDADDALQWALEKYKDDNVGLINFLMKHRHGTPFEHGFLTLFVDAPIFVWREWHRHRIGFSYNEESGRWSQLRPKFWIPESTRPMFVGPKYKPSRPELDAVSTPEQQEIYQWIVSRMKETYKIEYETYCEILERKVSKEVARAILPVGIYSRCWVSCNPRSLMAFLSLRTHDKTARYVSWPQYEIQVAARAAEQMLREFWPITYHTFLDNGRVAP